MPRDFVDVPAIRALAETDAAILAEFDGGRQIWIPHSQLEKIERRPDGSVVLRVARWLAEKEDLG